MRISIGTKSFIALVVTTLVILAATAAVVHWNFQRGFVDYVNDLRRGRIEVLVERLAEHYAQQESWSFLREDPRRLHALLSRRGHAERPSPTAVHRGERHDGPDQRARPPAIDPIGFARGIAVYDEVGERIIGPQRLKGERFDVISGERTVGFVISAPLRSLSADVDLRFAQRQGRLLMWTALGGLALAALVAWFFARQLVRPIRTLTSGTRELTAGRYGTTVAVNQQDELGQLASDFNALSHTLARSARQRKELMADVSHELRTPLAVLRGQIAALRDGVRTANDETLGALDVQISRLVDLVDELYDLSLADAGALSYEKKPLNLAALIRDTLAGATSRFEDREITLEQEWPESELMIFGDQRRLVQLFSNLFENSARYTDQGGHMRVRGERCADRIRVTVEDSAPGVPAEALPHMFERLYRVEKSRSRELGGAGLGLALVEKIAAAHGASLQAAQSQLGGVAMTIEFAAHETAHEP